MSSNDKKIPAGPAQIIAIFSLFIDIIINFLKLFINTNNIFYMKNKKFLIVMIAFMFSLSFVNAEEFNIEIETTSIEIDENTEVIEEVIAELTEEFIEEELIEEELIEEELVEEEVIEEDLASVVLDEDLEAE